eukprot:GHVU01134842.1.p1 GENE.GHVU01134842.1~~GHVU01134842.1.p1  ORF type:complete len:294 (+),score=34.49 GHVU01134842.1:132-884(+)
MTDEELIDYAKTRGMEIHFPTETIEALGEFPDEMAKAKAFKLYQEMAMLMSQNEPQDRTALLEAAEAFEFESDKEDGGEKGSSNVNGHGGVKVRPYWAAGPYGLVSRNNPATVQIDALLENGGPQSMTFSINAPFTSDWKKVGVDTCLEKVEWRKVNLFVKKCEVSSIRLIRDFQPICPASSQCPFGHSNHSKRFFCYITCKIIEYKICRNSVRNLKRSFRTIDATTDYNFYINKELPICKKGLESFMEH